MKILVLNKHKNKDNKAAAIILTPLIFWWFITMAFPIIFGFSLAFIRWNGLNATPVFVGLNNFKVFFLSTDYIAALWRSIWLGGLSTIITMAIGFLVGNMLNASIKCKGLFRAMWYVPAVTSVTVITQIILLLIDPQSGAINQLLVKIGLDPLYVEMEASDGIFVIMAYSVWKGAGANSLLWLAGLQAVDKQLYEAAEMDGANAVQRFFHVTIPSLASIAIYAVITGAIGAIQIYEQIAFITNGQPFHKTETLAFLIMRDAFQDYSFGMAGTSSVIMAIVVFGLSLIFLDKIFYIENKKPIGKKGRFML